MEAFRRGLAEHGYREGKDIVVEHRFAQGRLDRLPQLAAELLRLNVTVIVTESTPAALAVSAATKTTPIVMAVGTNPVNAGLAASLARPGGNLTGVTLTGANRTAKQLQVLKESMPSTTSVAVIYNAARQGVEAEVQEASETGRAIGLAIQQVAVRSPDDLAAAFDVIAKARPSALITIGDGMLLGSSRRIAEFSVEAKLPAVFPEQEFAEAGGLLAYGPDIGWNFRRAAWYVDRILKGAKPADLPIEQPTKWGLVVNLRTAKALGIKIPGSVLVRADEVIQ
jgi:putative ABC transport system substrate-binding protein